MTATKTCAEETCGALLPASRRSKYCKPHAKKARNKWEQTVRQAAQAREERNDLFERAINYAIEEAWAAYSAAKPTPMHIKGYPPIEGGVCGMAWVHFPNARKPIVNWLRRNDIGYKAYKKGWNVSSHWFTNRAGGPHDQSLERAEAACRAAAKTINSQLHPLEVGAYMASRID